VVKRHFALALILTAPLLLQGCGGDGPTKPKPPSGPSYPARSTPKNAVLYMSIAYANRDSVRTDSVYAGEYTGSSTDMTDPGSETLSFTKSDEVRHVGAMALSSDITDVVMDLNPPATWPQSHYVSDPSDWVTIQIPYFKIEVREASDNGFTATSLSPYATWVFEFTLKPTTPDPSSPTDTTWTIVRWAESRIGL
jgi:hypothetical protein